MGSKILLAVLGRGIMMEGEGGPFNVSRDRDWWDIKPGGAGRLTVFRDISDDEENAVIGGGELNLAAACELYDELLPFATVLAFGDNSPTFAAQGFPSEGSVMGELFVKRIKERRNMSPHVMPFDSSFRKVADKEESGTFTEVRHIFQLANRDGFDEVVFVTILAHMPRVVAMMEKHFQGAEFADLRSKVRYEVSDLVLLHADPVNYAERIWAMYGSQSYLRNMIREVDALKALQKGVTQSNQTGVVLNTETAASSAKT